MVFRRDFTDPDTVAQFAALVGNEERLKKLCLMTLADIDSVGPGTLTPWKEDLLWRLYVDAYNHLTLGYADELIQKDQADRSAVMSERPADISELELARFLRGLPRRYLSVFGSRRSISTFALRAVCSRGKCTHRSRSATTSGSSRWRRSTSRSSSRTSRACCPTSA